MRKIAITALICATVVALAGAALAQSDIVSLEAAAKKEGKLVFYSTENPAINDRLAKTFTAKYGVRVEVLRLATSDLLSRYATEANAGATVADVLVIADPRIFTNHPTWWAKLDVTALPELGKYPSESRETDFVRLYGHPLGITYSTERIPADKAPKNFADVLRSEFKGRIILTDPRSSSSWLGLADFWRRTLGDNYLMEIANGKPALADSAATAAQQVAAGAYDISFGSTPAHPAPLIAKGAKIAFVTPDETVIASQTMGISRNATSPNAARLFANFLLSKEGAEITCAGMTVSYRPDAEGCRKMPAKVEQVNLNISDQAKLLSLIGIGN